MRKRKEQPVGGGPGGRAAARQEYEAESLTGKRAQRGQVYTYEVKWKPKGGKQFANSFEPPTCLIGWEKEMKKVDKDIEDRATQAFFKPVARRGCPRRTTRSRPRAGSGACSNRADSRHRTGRHHHRGHHHRGRHAAICDSTGATSRNKRIESSKGCWALPCVDSIRSRDQPLQAAA